MLGERHPSRHPRYAEYVRLFDEESALIRAHMEQTMRFWAEHEARRAVSEPIERLVYGDRKRIVWRCDLCGRENPKRGRYRDIDGWDVWTVDDTSGVVAVRCPDCCEQHGSPYRGEKGSDD